jgi:hypothetical protein
MTFQKQAKETLVNSAYYVREYTIYNLVHVFDVERFEFRLVYKIFMASFDS